MKSASSSRESWWRKRPEAAVDSTLGILACGTAYWRRNVKRA
jgi:hypothetical protein